MSGQIGEIAGNVADVRARAAVAAVKSGRRPEDVTIIAVTKTIEPDRILAAFNEGMRDLGENRVQELCQKYDILDRGIKWHLIGHLQTNKVKQIIDKVSLIHSVDSIELAKEIDKRAGIAGIRKDILVQVNVAEEESKFGINVKQAPQFIRELAELLNIRVVGLMTVAPLAQDQEEIRWVFRGLKKLFIDIKQENIDNIYMQHLSMGMSNDFEAAIEEGATIVRVGTSIFGKRQY